MLKLIDLVPIANAISEARMLLGTLLLEERAPTQEEYESVDRGLIESFEAIKQK